MKSGLQKHRGVVVPMVTPFNADAVLDERAAEHIVDRLAAHELGVFVLGTTGEAASLPIPERRRLVEIAVSVAARRVPVFAGIGSNSMSETLSAARAYLRAGLDAVVAHLPSYYLLDPAEMQAYFEQLARDVPGPLVIYNIPQTTRMSLPCELVARLADLSSVIGFKDSENSQTRFEQVAAMLGGRPEFSIFMGVAALSVKALRRGFDGVVPGPGNFIPHLWHDLYESAAAGDWAQAEELQRVVDSIAEVFQRKRSVGQAIAGLKGAMSAFGLCSPVVLPPLVTCSERECAAFREELAALDLGCGRSVVA